MSFLYDCIKFSIALVVGLFVKIFYDILVKTYRGSKGERRSDYGIIIQKIDHLTSEVNKLSILVAKVETKVDMQKSQIKEIFSRLRDIGG